MFIAMNRFKIKLGCEQEFIDIWKGRDSYLNEVPGFKTFNLIKRSDNRGVYAVFISCYLGIKRSV